jgi:hypothetical protein
MGDESPDPARWCDEIVAALVVHAHQNRRMPLKASRAMTDERAEVKKFARHVMNASSEVVKRPFLTPRHFFALSAASF